MHAILIEAKLTDAQKQCLALWSYDHLTLAAIAERLNIARATVQTHLSRAMKKLEAAGCPSPTVRPTRSRRIVRLSGRDIDRLAPDEFGTLW